MKILVCLDGSEGSFNALHTACDIALKTGSYIIAFFVNEGQEYTAEATGWLSIRDKISDELESLGHETIYKAYQIGRDLGVSVEGIMSYGLPADEIIKYVSSHGIVKLIAMGHSTKGRGTQEFAESTTRKVVSMSRIPVLVTSSSVVVRRILVCVDDPGLSRETVLFGGHLSQSLKADIGIISVVPDVEEIMAEYRKIAEVPNIEKHMDLSVTALEEKAEQTVLSAHVTLSSLNLKAYSVIRKGDPFEEISQEAGLYDMLIVGTQGMSPSKKIGKTTKKLLDSGSLSIIFV